MTAVVNAAARAEDGRRVIRQLTAAVAAQIAAGEVIERPASVVKELLENALDAGARRIRIEIEGAGLTRICVSDDGCGIPAAELALAFERHATSKLRAVADLEQVGGYGFRGEALPSIAAVADVECTSHAQGAELGARIRFQAGNHGGPVSCGVPPGTSIEVRDLFARQPARRKFLATPRSERAAITRVCSAAALARPEVVLGLSIDGRRTFQSSGEGSRRAVLQALWGGEVATAALPFASAERDGAGMRVEGLAAPPPHQRGRRGGVLIFVNCRPVQSRRLSYAVEEAYGDLLPRGRYPLAACFLWLAGKRVDINVHPAKASVKLEDEGAAFALIQRSVRAALLDGTAPRPALKTARADAASTLLDAARPPTHAALLSGRATSDVAAGLGGAGATAPPLPGLLPLLRVVGQIDARFIVAEGLDGLYLLDQHAAHERVLYERLLAAREDGKEARQTLLDPPLLELGVAQAAVLAERAEALAAAGFELEQFGGRSVRLRAVPACFVHADGSMGDMRSRVLALLEDLAGGAEGAERGDATYDAVAALTACHAAVRAGQRLSDEEMRHLLRDLETSANPHTCPHGRPTVIHLATSDLERRFGRR